MAERTMDRVLDMVREGLEKARDEMSGKQLGTTSTELVLRFGVNRLIGFVDQLRLDLDNRELVELSVVYGCVAQQFAAVLARPEQDVLRALVELCGDSAADPLVRGLPPADPAVREALRTSLVRITVRYEAPADTEPERVIQILYGADRDGVLSRTVKQRISWDELPDDVREQMIRRGEKTVQFGVFPRGA